MSRTASHTALVGLFSLVQLAAPLAAAIQDPSTGFEGEARAQAHLLAGDVDEALRVLEPGRVEHPDLRRDYLYAVALQRQVLHEAGLDELALLRRKTDVRAPGLNECADAFADVAERALRATDEPEAVGTEIDFAPSISWCTPRDERYPEPVYRLCAHLECIRWGPLNLRSGEVAVPGRLRELRHYAVARLATLSRHLDARTRSRLRARLTAAGERTAGTLLALDFANARDAEHWRGLSRRESPDDWLFVASVIGSLTTGVPADSVVPTFRRLAPTYPLLAREFVGWADRRNVPYDAEALGEIEPQGPLRIRVFESDGSAAESVQVTLTRGVGDQLSQVFCATTAHDGSIDVARTSLQTPCDVRVRGFRIGSVTARDHLLKQFEVPALLGAIAPDIVLPALHDGPPLRLSELRGKVVYLDFWATWCGPCQAPLRELDELVDRHGASWGERAAVFAVSIDSDRSKARAHVAERGWTSVAHRWVGDEVRAVQDELRFHGVPTAFLIDASGRIVWRGHPSSIDVLEHLRAAIGSR